MMTFFLRGGGKKFSQTLFGKKRGPLPFITKVVVGFQNELLYA